VSRLLPIQLATLRYRSRRDPQLALRMRLRELAASRVWFGYRRIARTAAAITYLVVYEPEAAVVPRIFADYVAGHSTR
jgi:hypothetical protein